ncbi:hypothetical protein ART_1221 [Arthrobacter sp. PAMC 25486]|nr:hypothetical protein ART_1221 [Arthrobacter sp. PAMC 25486]
MLNSASGAISVSIHLGGWVSVAFGTPLAAERGCGYPCRNTRVRIPMQEQ